MDHKEIKALAREIVRLTGSELVTTSGVALMLGMSDNSTALREIIARDDFPIATRVNGAGRRRWLRADVSAWIERQAVTGMGRCELGE